MLKPEELEFWNQYLLTLADPTQLKNAQIEAFPAGSFEITDSLIELYLAGKKHAGSGLVEDYESCGDPLPEVGNFWIVLGGDKSPRILLKTIKIEINKFGELPESIAIAEGEGDLSVAYWKKAHAAFYLPNLEKWGIADLDQARVITEFFEFVYPLK